LSQSPTQTQQPKPTAPSRLSHNNRSKLGGQVIFTRSPFTNARLKGCWPLTLAKLSLIPFTLAPKVLKILRVLSVVIIFNII
jgi:hypothetical protein